MACVVFYLEDSPPKVVKLDDAEVVTIGRHPESVVVLKNASVSSHHATIKKREKGFFVQDTGSSNGTRLNGADIEESILNDGDRVSFGDVQTVFYAGEPPPLAASPATAPASALPVVAVPAPPPDLMAAESPAFTAPPPRSRRRFVPSRKPSGYPDDSGGGCATALFLTGLFIVAFFIGLSLRHLKETDRSLMTDLINRITKNMPKVKIEE